MRIILTWISSGILILCMQVPSSDSTATVEISFLDFINPFQRKFDGDCCDPACESACDLLYHVCFNDTSPAPECLTKVYSILVTPGSMLVYHLNSWPGQLPMKILVDDIDAGKNDFVDYFIITLNISSVPYSSQPSSQSPISSTTTFSNAPTSFLTTVPTPSQSTVPVPTVTSSMNSNSAFTYSGLRDVFQTQILLNVVVACDPNYYSAACDVFCASHDSCEGHYTCNNVTGEKVCLPQWTGSDCSVWSGSGSCLSPSAPPTTNTATGPCQMFDVVLILDSSGSVNNLNSENWSFMRNFAKSLSNRVAIGRSDFQFGVVTFSDSAQLNIKLNDALTAGALQNRLDALPYLGQKTNLRAGLRLARTDAFLARNGGRNAARRSVILVYDGEKPTPEFGTLVNEASQLRDLGIIVNVVSLNYFFSKGLATLDLVTNIASFPVADHLFYNLDSWSRLSNTIAPTILANLYNTCQREISSNVGTTVVSSGTVASAGTTVPAPSAAEATSVPTSGTSLVLPSSTTFLLFSNSAAAVPDQYCSFRGSCSSANGTNTCCCQPGYVGNQCEYEDDPCIGNPCNGGTCNRISPQSFSCLCLPGFSGDRCQIVGSYISTCPSSTTTTPPPPSQCSLIPQAPCTEFYYGANCATFCRPENTCRAHTSCNSNGQTVCLPGWKNVSTNCTENDGYNSTGCTKLCLNGGFCFGNICCCQSGFTGETCNISNTGMTVTATSVFTSVITNVTGATSSRSSTTLPFVGASSSTTLPFVGASSSTTLPVVSQTISSNSSAAPTTVYTGITNTTAAPTTVYTGITSPSTPSTLFTGITSPSTPSTLFTGITSSVGTGVISTSALSASTSSAGSGVTSNYSASAATGSASSTLVSTTVFNNASTATTLSLEDQLYFYLRDYIRNNFPNLSPIEQQQLLNQLLSILLGPVAVALVDPSSRLPIYTSPPWPGSGRLSNYSIQLEILEAYIDKDQDNNWQLKLKYYYILTDLKSGDVTQVSPDEYQQLMYEIDDLKVDVSHLDPANRFQIVVYGNYLDISMQRKFSAALRNAYGLPNSAWTAKSSARVLIGDVEEVIALSGEDLTLFNFWLVSNSSDTESPNSIVSPSNSAINTELSNLGIITNISQSVAWFRANESYGIFVKDVVYYKDFVKFSQLLSWYLENNSSVPHDFTAKVVKLEKFFLSNGTSVNRLIYFVYHTTSLVVIPKSLGFVPPTTEQLMTIISLSGIQIPYELVKTSESAGAMRLEQAFYLSVFDHPVGSTFSMIQGFVEERIRKIPNYVAANVRVVAAEEYFYLATNKRLSFNRILWFLFNNGTLVDGRRYQSMFPPMAEWMSLLQAVKLPNGERYQFVTDDMTDDDDVVVRRSECFYQPISTNVLNFEIVEKAMTSVLQRQTLELITNQSTVDVAYSEEYVDASGSSVTVLFYIIKTPNRDLHFTDLDASMMSEDIVPTSSLASEIASYGFSSSYTFFTKSYVDKITRYATLFHLFSKQPPLQADRNKISQTITNYFKSLSATATAKVLTVEEFVEKDGCVDWGIGYSLTFDGKTVWPETLNTADIITNVDFISATGASFTLILPDSADIYRVKDMFSFFVSDALSISDLKILEKLLAQQFQQEFPEFVASIVEINIVSVMELVNTNGNSIWKVFYQLNVDRSSLSALQHNAISNSNLLSILSFFSTSRLWTGNSGLLAEVPSLSSVVMNRILFPDDLILFEQLLQTAVAQTLERFANLSGQFVLSVRRQRECVTPNETVQWCVDFLAFVAGEALYPGLLPMNRLDASAFSNSFLHASSLGARYELVDSNPSFSYDYRKSFHVVLNQKLNSSGLAQLETFLTQLYESVAPNSEVELKVAGIEEVIIMSDRSLLDSPSAWQVLFYVTLDGIKLNGALENIFNSSVVNAFIQRSNQVAWKGMFIFDVNSRIVRKTDSLKLLFLGTVSSMNFPALNGDLRLRLQQALGTQNVSATALQRLSKISLKGIIYTEICFLVMQNGLVLNADLIRRDSLNKISYLNGIALISDPDSSIPGGLYERSSLFSVSFQQPVTGSSSLVVLATTLARAYEGPYCSRASVATVVQFEAIQGSKISAYMVLYTLSCNGIWQDSRTYGQKLNIDNLKASLRASGISSQLYIGETSGFIPVSQLLRIPFTTNVTSRDYSIIEQILQQSAASLSSELSAIKIQVLDQRDYLDVSGNFFYTLLCSATLNGKILYGTDLYSVVDRSVATIEHIIGPSGSEYKILSFDPAVLRPALSAAVIYFENYILRADEEKLLLAVTKAIPGLQDKFQNITAKISRIDRVLDVSSRPLLRYFIFLTTPLMPNDIIDLSLELQVDESILSFTLPMMSPITSLTTSVRELRKSFLLKVLGFVAVGDASIFLQKLQVLWSHTVQGYQVQGAVTDEYVGENGETITGLAYFVVQQGAIVDPTSVQVPSEEALKSNVFSAMPTYESYAGSVFLYQEAFCYVDEGDISVAKANWKIELESRKPLRILQFQPAFGLYGISVTRVCYTASVNGSQLVPGRDSAPIAKQELVNEIVVRKDALYSFMFYGLSSSELLVELADILEVSWEKSLGTDISVLVYGSEVKLTAFPGITFITELSYGVMHQGSMMRPIDRPPPSVDDILKNVSLQGFSGESVKLRSVLLNDPRPISNLGDKIINAIKVAWNNIPGNMVKVKIPDVSQEMLSNEFFEPIVKVYYAVTQQNDSDAQDSLEPSFEQLSEQLLTQGLQRCSCNDWHNFRFYTKESRTILNGKLNAVVAALRRAWIEANPDIEQSLIDIKVNQTKMGERKKRGINSLAYEDSDGNQLTAFDYHVAIQNRNPNALFVRYPSESAILQDLLDIAALRACSTCTLQKCGSIYIDGKLSSSDYSLVELAIVNAFVNANQPDVQTGDITASIKEVTEVKDASGGIVSEIDFCVYWTTNLTILNLMTPSYDLMSTAVKVYGKKAIPSDVMQATPETPPSNNVNIPLIVALSVVGSVLLLLVIGLIIGIIVYRRRKLAATAVTHDEQKLSSADSDSFIGHALYNPSPYNSLKNGPVQSKLQFRDSVASDIST